METDNCKLKIGGSRKEVLSVEEVYKQEKGFDYQKIVQSIYNMVEENEMDMIGKERDLFVYGIVYAWQKYVGESICWGGL